MQFLTILGAGLMLYVLYRGVKAIIDKQPELDEFNNEEEYDDHE